VTILYNAGFDSERNCVSVIQNIEKVFAGTCPAAESALAVEVRLIVFVAVTVTVETVDVALGSAAVLVEEEEAVETGFVESGLTAGRAKMSAAYPRPMPAAPATARVPVHLRKRRRGTFLSRSPSGRDNVTTVGKPRNRL